MKILIYTVVFIALLVPLVVILGLLLKSISFLVSSFISFKEKFFIKKDIKTSDIETEEEKTTPEMETVEISEA